MGMLMDIYEIVNKLIGEIRPAGDSNLDDKRFENLKVMTELVSSLLKDINQVSECELRSEFSVKRAGKYAGDFLREWGI